jgi:hypothetical protein
MATRSTQDTQRAKRTAEEPIANRGVHGEGNYRASRVYNEATRRFVRSGRVEQAGRQAKPRDRHEAAELERAEQAGKSRAKGEDPELASGGTTGKR